VRFTYRAIVAYDGSRYCGFSLQPGERTVESVLLAALQPIVPELPRIACGGRTDRGVHATAQALSFYAREALACDTIASALDAADPDYLTVREVRRVPNHFHASFSAIGRRYVYLHPEDVDVVRIDAMLRALVGVRCFSAFARDTPSGANTVRRLFAASASRALEGIRFDFHASGFLRRQVRVMVATALREALRESPTDVLVELAARGDRRATAPSAAAENLYLVGIDYLPFGV